MHDAGPLTVGGAMLTDLTATKTDASTNLSTTNTGAKDDIGGLQIRRAFNPAEICHDITRVAAFSRPRSCKNCCRIPINVKVHVCGRRQLKNKL